jgi:hypothetical protein
MPDISPVIEALVTSMLERSVVSSRTAKTERVLLVFAALCAGTGVFFLALALYQYLESLFAPPVAALASAAAVFATAVLAVLLREYIGKKAPAHKPARDEFSENIHALITSLYHELEEPIRENPKMSVAIAALAGLFAARRL